MIKYREQLISKNSQAYQLWLKKDFAALDKHLKDLEIVRSKLEGRK